MSTILLRSEEIIFGSQLKERLTAAFDPEEFREAAANAKQVRVQKISYRSGGHAVNGFIIEPKKKGTYPCIIYNRGGTGEFGSIKLGQLFLFLARMARWGYVVIATQYSGNGGSEGRDEFGGKDLDDVLNLRKILEDHPSADASRIGMYGASRGGMMTYLCLGKVRWIRAAVSVAGWADLFRSAEQRPDMKKVHLERFGGSDGEMKKRSAVLWAKKFSKKTPLLMMHGTADWRVSPLDSLDMSRLLFEARVPHRLIIFEGADHSLTEFKSEKEAAVKEWFDRFVRDGASLPDLKPRGK